MAYPLITNAMLILTKQCNLQCKYCYENKKDEIMTLDTLKNIINILNNNACQSETFPRISFFGGEPLLYYEELIKPACQYAKELNPKFNLSITTNGTLLTEDILNYFKLMNVNIMLSIDGCEESHNLNRKYFNGEGSFSDIEAIIPSLLQKRPNTVARMTVTPENCKYIFDSLKCMQNFNFDTFNILPNEFDNWSDDDFIEIENQMNLIKDYIINSFEQEEIPLVPRLIEQMFCKRVIKEYEVYNNRHRQTSSSLPCSRCGLGLQGKVVIDPNGDIFTCPHCSLNANEEEIMWIGNIATGINEERIDNLLKLNENHPMTAPSGIKCEDCPLNSICSGGCTPNKYLLTGDFNQSTEIYCKWMQIMYKTAEDIANYFDERKNNDLFKEYFYGCVIRGVDCVC